MIPLDTREKIVPLELAAEWRAETAARVVTGYFDPVVAEHASRLGELGDSLVVLIAEPPDPLLPQRARAELVAALRTVARVVMLEDMAVEQALELMKVGEAQREEAADLDRRAALVSHIRARYAAS
jgi:hypothetical protein